MMPPVKSVGHSIRGTSGASEMAFQLDSRVTELLCARLCHDLIGPVAAINNGVELVTDFGDEMQGEAIALIGESATKASNLLQFYRVAFGSARNAEGTGIGLGEARERALDALTSDRIAIDWPTPSVPDGGPGTASRLAVKLVLNLVLLGTEVLPGSGKVAVAVRTDKPASVDVTAEREGLVLEADLSEVLGGHASVEDLTARTVQAYLTRSLAESIGRGLRIDFSPGKVTFGVEMTTPSERARE